MARKNNNNRGKNNVNDDEEAIREMNKFLSKLLAETAKNLANAERNGVPLVLGFNFNIENGAMMPKGMRQNNQMAANAVQQPQARERNTGELVDVIENKGKVTVIAEMRGASGKEIEISCEGDYAEINAKSAGYHKMVKLPYNVDPKSMRYHFTNGVLEMTADKAAA
ncbi:MAG: Hsp20/alpha crystallin family protein [Candidatus Marsarchaeota archaeon]|jgi:HSP20 family molecular chaperone IbpA|nr:Hsp20/alpha crystallin family protein [Candidatus Marsarchaeota archaeon]